MRQYSILQVVGNEYKKLVFYYSKLLYYIIMSEAQVTNTLKRVRVMYTIDPTLAADIFSDVDIIKVAAAKTSITFMNCIASAVSCCVGFIDYCQLWSVPMCLARNTISSKQGDCIGSSYLDDV